MASMVCSKLKFRSNSACFIGLCNISLILYHQIDSTIPMPRKSKAIGNHHDVFSWKHIRDWILWSHQFLEFDYLEPDCCLSPKLIFESLPQIVCSAPREEELWLDKTVLLLQSACPPPWSLQQFSFIETVENNKDDAETIIDFSFSRNFVGKQIITFHYWRENS